MKQDAKVIEIQFTEKTQFILLFVRVVFVIFVTILWACIMPVNRRMGRILTFLFNLSGIGSVIAWSFIAIVFFIGFFSIKRSLKDLPALTLTNEGILYHSVFFVAKNCFVGWEDIMEIKEIETRNQKLLNIIAKDPQKYIEGQKSFFEKIFMRINLKTFGAVISISPSILKCSHAELRTILNKKFEFYKNSINH